MYFTGCLPTLYTNIYNQTISGVVEEKYKMEYYKRKGAKFYRPKIDSPDDDSRKTPSRNKVSNDNNSCRNTDPDQSDDVCEENRGGMTWKEFGTWLQNAMNTLAQTRNVNVITE